MENAKGSLAKEMMWNSIGNLVYCICQWVITILTVRLCSYEMAGYLSLAMSTSSTFSTISLFSMRNYQVSDIERKYDDRQYVGSRVLTCCLALFLCFIYTLNISSEYQKHCIMSFMIIRLVEGAVDVLHGIDQKYGRYDVIGKSLFIRGIITVICFIAGILVTSDLFIALVLTAIGNIAAVLFYDIRKTGSLEKITVEVHSGKVFSLLKECIPLVISSFLISLIPLIPKNAIQAIQGNEILGVYSSIASPTMVVQVFAQYAFGPLLPRISVMFTEKRYDQFLDLFHRFLAIFLGFSVFITLGAVILGRFGLSLLYGKSILEYYSLFLPLVWCTIGTAGAWILISIVTAIRKQKSLMFIMLLGFVVDFILTDFMITNIGTNGASYIQIICFFTEIILMFIVIEESIYRMKQNDN